MIHTSRSKKTKRRSDAIRGVCVLVLGLTTGGLLAACSALGLTEPRATAPGASAPQQQGSGCEPLDEYTYAAPTPQCGPSTGLREAGPGETILIGGGSTTGYPQPGDPDAPDPAPSDTPGPQPGEPDATDPSPSSTPGPQPGEPDDIGGTISVERTPVAGACVELVDDEATVKGRQETASDGSYSFADVEWRDGVTWSVRARIDYGPLDGLQASSGTSNPSSPIDPDPCATPETYTVDMDFE